MVTQTTDKSLFQVYKQVCDARDKLNNPDTYLADKSMLFGAAYAIAYLIGGAVTEEEWESFLKGKDK